MKHLKKFVVLCFAVILLSGVFGIFAAAEEIRFDVTSYGATGDGITDDGAAIQDALNSCNENGGGTVFFPSGTYCISKTVFFYSNQQLLFEDGAVLKRIENQDGYGCGVFLCNWFKPEDTINSSVACRNVQIIGGTFDGGGAIPEAAPQNVAMINTCHTENITVSGCTFIYNYNAHCIEINSSDGVDIENCTFRDYMGDEANIPYNEMIQIDKCVNSSLGSFYDELYRQIKGYYMTTQIDANSADGKASSDINIYGCSFDGNRYCSAIGNHHQSATEAYNHSINIYNNIFTGGCSERGYIVLDMHTSGVDVYSNKFYGGTLGVSAKADNADVVAYDNVFEACEAAYKGNVTAYLNLINGEYDAYSAENAVIPENESKPSGLIDSLIKFFQLLLDLLRKLFETV